MRRVAWMIALSLLAAGIWAGIGPAPAFELARPPQEFWGHWGDGRAELSGFELSYPRYGAVRRGTAVTIFVTEDFAHSVRVKSENPAREHGDIYPVMKLNWIQDFSTGIYDYNLMTSVFSPLREVADLPPRTPTKISFGSQEWCGQVYSQLKFERDRVRLTSHSYFDGEADRDDRLEVQPGGLVEDAILLWARGLSGPQLARGETRSFPLLPSLERSRLQHFAIGWTAAAGSRSEAARVVEVPAGTFEVETYTLAIDEGEVEKTFPPGRGAGTIAAYSWTIDVESSEPHRIVRWARSDGLEARLVASERLAYWKLNGPGAEAELEKLGLKPRPPQTP